MVRAKIVEVNPEILKEFDSPQQIENWRTNKNPGNQHRRIGLTDVLLAIQEKQPDLLYAQAGYLSGVWNLRNDDLTQQSDETISFLFSLLV